MTQPTQPDQPSMVPGSPSATPGVLSATPHAYPSSVARSVPDTGDPEVDQVLASFVAQTSAVSDSAEDDVARRVEAATQAHRQLQARLSTQRE